MLHTSETLKALLGPAALTARFLRCQWRGLPHGSRLAWRPAWTASRYSTIAGSLHLPGVRCLLECVSRRPIKAIDALLVHCDCPHTYALRDHGATLGTHGHGSEKQQVDALWRGNASRPRSTHSI